MNEFPLLVDAAGLAGMLDRDELLVVDCRFELSDPASGRRAFEQGHIPGAVYANLDRDLSDLSRAGLGRHPVPSDEAFSAVLSRWGWTPETMVVAYDAAGGALAAARLWWMLRLAGARRVAVLDGGIAAWTRAGLPLETAERTRSPSTACVRLDQRQIVGSDAVAQCVAPMLLLDARGAPRFRGEDEPID
jgi:thiosulfate/3-mercaptopyruvate sulfurtransferase